MRFFYDTEFLEDGKTIELISIGIVAVPEGNYSNVQPREYYAINSDAPWERIEKHIWLCENVVPHLPLVDDVKRHLNQDGTTSHYTFSLDHLDSCVKPHWVIANEVRDFILGSAQSYGESVKLWAWYGAYDHVALMQLWGSMMNKPNRIPMFTHDFRQHIGANHVDTSTDNVHNALDDARWLEKAFSKYEMQRMLELQSASSAKFRHSEDVTQLIPLDTKPRPHHSEPQ